MAGESRAEADASGRTAQRFQHRNRGELYLRALRELHLKNISASITGIFMIRYYVLEVV
jgi:hypothetical protein